ncbi:MAG: bifunctional serine/threonine-protein kinase/formylglycine-generating enzyme family protein [Acidobacteriota bacterium]|nr:bifunctional serine/threonine-protein kinase/formylglycine-generating enzyme family protein [Acidobacteriota bacterium]
MSIICEHCGHKNSDFDTSCVNCDHLIIREPDSFLEEMEPISDELEEQIRRKLSSRLKIQGEIGRGGMALVYRALDPSLKRQVAVKCMPVLLNRDQTVLQRFRREAQVMANLNHPHIVRVFSVDHLEGIHYFTMAWLTGGDLNARLRRGLSLEESIRIVREAASALDYAHGKGLVHRDIKPGNIMFDEHGATQLLDFGIAKVLNRTQLTMTQSFMGTPYYMSPEQAKGGKVDGRCDLYSLGVVFYQMATNTLPFDSEEPMSVIYMHSKEKPKPPIKIKSDLPAPVSKIILKLMEKDPNKRYQTGGELIEALNQIMAPMPRLTLSQPPRRMPTEMRGKHRPASLISMDKLKTIIKSKDRRVPMMAGAGILLLLTAILLPILSGPEEPPPLPPPPPPTYLLAGNAGPIPDFCPLLPEPVEPPKPERQPKPKPKPRKPSVDPRVVAEQRRIRALKEKMNEKSFVTMPPGEFKMGARLRGKRDAKPSHKVVLRGFAIGATEVTQDLWALVMGDNPSCNEGPDFPVENVSYTRIQTFLAKLSKDTGAVYRLPTEAEWEYACKAGHNRNDNLMATAWHDGNTENSRQVGTRDVSAVGLYDMQGNVREWCSDWYGDDYYKTSPEADPTGPEAGTERVVRGGGWQSKPSDLRPFVRDRLLPDLRACDVGFRLVRELGDEGEP